MSNPGYLPQQTHFTMGTFPKFSNSQRQQPPSGFVGNSRQVNRPRSQYPSLLASAQRQMDKMQTQSNWKAAAAMASQKNSIPKCAHCHTNPVNVQFMPCMHWLYCDTCWGVKFSSERCPKCRVEIESVNIKPYEKPINSVHNNSQLLNAAKKSTANENSWASRALGRLKSKKSGGSRKTRQKRRRTRRSRRTHRKHRR